MIKKMIFSLLLIGAQSALAQDVIPAVNLYCAGYSDFLAVGIANVHPGTQLTCADLKPLTDLYSDLVNTMAPVAQAPIYLAVENGERQGGQQFMALRNILASGLDMSSESQREGMKKSFAHEIGHHIFGTYLQANEPTYAQIGGIIASYNDDMVAKRKSVDSDALFLDSEFIQFNQFIDSANLPPDLAYFDYVGVAYQELFADIVSAVYFNNPDSMKEAIARFETDGKDYGSGMRGFTKNWPMTPQTAQRPHLYFASIRATIWQDWVSYRTNDKKKMLTELMQIFTSEIQRRRASGEPYAQLSAKQAVSLNELNVKELLAKLFPKK